jgi:hypothetical protein
VARRPHLDPLALAVEERDVVERIDVEVRVELAVDHVQHVAVELRGHALAVVVRGLEHLRVLDEVGAEEAGDRRAQRLRQPRRKRRRLPGVKLPIVPPRNAIDARPERSGSVPRWRSKSPTMPCTRRPGYSATSAGRGSRTSLGHVDGT